MNNFFYWMAMFAICDSARSNHGEGNAVGGMIVQLCLFLLKCVAVLIPACIFLWVAILLVSYQPWYVFMPFLMAPFIMGWIFKKAFTLQIRALSTRGLSEEKAHEIAFGNILYSVGFTLIGLFLLGLFLFIYYNADDKVHPIKQALEGVIGFLSPFIISVLFFRIKEGIKGYFASIRRSHGSQ